MCDFLFSISPSYSVHLLKHFSVISLLGSRIDPLLFMSDWAYQSYSVVNTKLNNAVLEVKFQLCCP